MTGVFIRISLETEGSLLPSIWTDVQKEDLVKIQREDGHQQAKERDLGRSEPCQHLDLGFLAYRTVRK